MKRLTSDDFDLLHAEASLWNVVSILHDLNAGGTGFGKKRRSFQKQISDLRVTAVILAERIGELTDKFVGDK